MQKPSIMLPCSLFVHIPHCTFSSLPQESDRTLPHLPPLQRPAWPRRVLQSRHLSDNTNTMKNVVWGAATHSWGKAKLHISAAVALPGAEQSLCGSTAGATSGERSGCPTCQGHRGPAVCCCLQPTVCFQMLGDVTALPGEETGALQLVFLPAIITARADGICLGLICMGYDTLGITPRIDVSSQTCLQKHIRPHSCLNPLQK